MKDKVACPICIGKKGLKGSDLAEGKCDYAFDSTEEFAVHMEKEHHICVVRDGETNEQAEQRFKKTNPDAHKKGTCKCPQCEAKQGDYRAGIIMELRKISSLIQEGEIKK